MAKKKEYYIPMTEIVCLEVQIPIAIANSKESVPDGSHAPMHPSGDKVF